MFKVEDDFYSSNTNQQCMLTPTHVSTKWDISNAFVMNTMILFFCVRCCHTLYPLAHINIKDHKCFVFDFLNFNFLQHVFVSTFLPVYVWKKTQSPPRINLFSDKAIKIPLTSWPSKGILHHYYQRSLIWLTNHLRGHYSLCFLVHRYLNKASYN